MAIGNNGNILQHWVELEAAQALLAEGGAAGVRCVFTHGMAPFERFEHPLPDNEPKTRVMSRALRMGERLRQGGLPREGQPVLFQAIAELDVSPQHYPNSAILLDWLTRTRSAGLRMTVCEVTAAAQEGLKKQWSTEEDDARVKVVCGSWRQALQDGALAPRGPAGWPWLVSMDPYTFDPAPNGPASNLASVSAGDIDSLKSLLGPLLESTPGLFALFCYSMSEALRRKFQNVVRDFAAALPGAPAVALIGCKRDATIAHVAALVSKDSARLASLEKAAKRFLGTADYAPPI